MMLRNYLTALFRYSGFNTSILLGLMVFLGVTQGIGLAMILPFHNVIGLDVSAGDSIYTREFTRIASSFGLPLNLTTVVLAYIAIIFLYAGANRAK